MGLDAWEGTQAVPLTRLYRVGSLLCHGRRWPAGGKKQTTPWLLPYEQAQSAPVSWLCTLKCPQTARICRSHSGGLPACWPLPTGACAGAMTSAYASLLLFAGRPHSEKDVIRSKTKTPCTVAFHEKLCQFPTGRNFSTSSSSASDRQKAQPIFSLTSVIFCHTFYSIKEATIAWKQIKGFREDRADPGGVRRCCIWRGEPDRQQVMCNRSGAL